MTDTNPTLRLSCAALAAAGALVGAMAMPAGHAAAQSAYRSQTYPPPPAYPQPAYEAPAYPPPGYGPPAYEAPGYYPPAYREQMTIIAPGVHRRDLGRSDSGMPVEELTASRVVNIRDLDLSRQEDVDAMDYRVRMAAVDACRALERAYPESLYPSYSSSDADRCVVRAINDGVAQEREAVATAEANAYAAAAYRR